ncbi:MAG TPA: hypothetical protein VGT01_05885 [Candidatus Dormibacteraeota bacterium]|nr:hypothetical protein [Candidatus Dormibacteraeota bacterium]
MDVQELEPDPSVLPARARRGLALIVGSCLAIAITGITYLHPSLDFMAGSAGAPHPTDRYSVTAIDFVDTDTGWVAIEFETGDFALLHTTDGGLSWTRQMFGRGGGRRPYLKFFDALAGVFGLVGGNPVLFRTTDAGRTWAPVSIRGVGGMVLSWSFVDSDYGWALVSGTSPDTPLPAYLYRTVDGGGLWTNLGVPAPAPDQVFQASFSYLTTGWLTSANDDGPYVYKTIDYGQSWTRVALPAPSGGWPHGGTFLVATQPTAGGGVLASVVFVPALHGRKSGGAIIRDFPPLTVRAFDGGRPVTYTYATGVGDKDLGPIPQNVAPAPNQVLLSTVDGGASWKPITVPAALGAVGYFDAANWWWVGSGKLASSRDGGATWTSLRPVTAPEPSPGTLQVFDGAHALFAVSNQSPPSLETTHDGGAHWRAVPLPPILDAPMP